MKNSLVKPAVLALCRSDLSYVLYTDACDKQLGAVLMQRYADNSLRPTGYYSRSLTAAKHDYDSTERENLSIVWALLLLRPYLYGKHFHIRTDHDYL